MDPHLILTTLVHLLVTPKLLGLMLLAVPLGIFFGCIPGLGGKLGIVLLIPFVYGMSPLAGAVFLLSMHAIVHTGGVVPSILFGVPTNGPEAPLLVDGYPMASNGQAGRALGASLGAAGIGGVIGVVCLALILPVVEPFVLSFGPVDFFWLAIIGITLISALSGEMLVQGLIVGLFGWLMGMVGLDPATGVQRYTFHQLFLWDGFDVISGVLAIYALPEMMQLSRRAHDRTCATTTAPAIKYSFAEVWGGVLETVQHWGLTITTSVMGTFIGMIPGLGGEAAGWLNYAYAASRYGKRRNFGKGAIEGVIAPSTGMNAKEGGGLLPTLLFGVPAGSGMAVMLGALIMLGIQPGPMIVVKHLPLLWSLIWAIVLSNLLCTTLLVLVSKHMSAITQIRTDVLVPIVLTFALLGTYLAKDHWQNMVLFAALGALGYLMARNHWPRPCFIIGLVLGPIAERSLHKATALYGTRFLLEPTSLVMMAIVVLSLVFNLTRSRRHRHLDGPEGISSTPAGGGGTP